MSALSKQFHKPALTIVRSAKRLYERGLVVGFEGNLSLRVGAERLLISRSRCCKGDLTLKDVMLMDLQGEARGGTGVLSSERELHLYFYRRYPQIKAIIHAHPPYAIACSLAGTILNEVYLAETQLILGPIAQVPYSTPGTLKLSAAVDQVLEKKSTTLPTTFVLERHGAVTVSENLADALQLMETLEQTCKITTWARTLGPITPLTGAQLAELEELKRRAPKSGM